MDVATLPTAVPKRPRQSKMALLKFILACLDAQSEQVRVVQVGANDGQLDDPIQDFWSKDYWNGVLIEPHPLYFSELTDRHRGNPNVTLVNAAVSETTGAITLYHLDESFRDSSPSWLRGCASLDKARMNSAIEIANQKRNVALPPTAVAETNVAARRLDEILAEQDVETADILIIDVEGHEVPVLNSFDPVSLDIKLAIVESNSGDSEERKIVSLLHRAGLVAFKIASDIVAIRPGSIDVPIEAMLHFNRFVPLSAEPQPTTAHNV